jgi:hypothetical protein
MYPNVARFSSIEAAANPSEKLLKLTSFGSMTIRPIRSTKPQRPLTRTAARPSLKSLACSNWNGMTNVPVESMNPVIL